MTIDGQVGLDWTGTAELVNAWAAAWDITEAWTGVLEGRMSAAKAKKTELLPGDTRTITITVQTPDKQAFDLTDYTVEWSLYLDTGAPVLRKRSDIPGEIVVADQADPPMKGKFSFTVNSAETLGLEMGSYQHVTRIEDANGNGSAILKGEIVVEPLWG